jgi:acyl carrier protein
MEAHVNDLNANLPVSAGTGRQPTDAESRLAELIVTALQLEMSPTEIVPEAPLFGSGASGGLGLDSLGLDSIDALELALAISREHGIELRSDDQRNHQIFASLASLSAYVETHRAAGPRATPPSP